MKIPFVGGTILLMLCVFSGLLFVGIPALIVGDENFVGLLIATQIGMWLLPALAYAFCCYEKPWDSMQVKVFGKRADYGLFVLLYLITLPLIGYLAEISEYIPFFESLKEASRATEARTKEFALQLVSGKTFKDLMLALLVMAVLPAICEEVFFRGVVLNNLVKRNFGIHLSVWLSAILFSAIHIEFLGFLSRVLVGAVLGYAFVYSKSLWLPIVLHFLNNAILVVAYFILQEKILDDDEFSIPHWIAAICVIASVFLFRFLFNRYNASHSNSE